MADSLTEANGDDMNQSLRFEFGDNWQSFVRQVNDQRVALAVDSLKRLLQTEHLTDQTFLDIGCGSGLFSLAACLLGAAKVVSFDYDLNSVQASRSLKAKTGLPDEVWSITPGDVLDPVFFQTLAPADIVYSWGVLHHTGEMWRAIDQAASKVKPGGCLVLALYNTTRTSRLWWRLKRGFNQLPRPAQWLLEKLYAGVLIMNFLVTGRNPVVIIRDYASASARGMSFSHDVRDWLGGFPYEYAAPSEVLSHLRGRFGFVLEYLNTVNGLGCNEYTFRRPG